MVLGGYISLLKKDIYRGGEVIDQSTYPYNIKKKIHKMFKEIKHSFMYINLLYRD